jgi:hypothetical protein
MHYFKSNSELADLRDCIPLIPLKRLYPADLVTNGYLSTQQHSPETTSTLAIENGRENFTGIISYMSLTLSTQMLLNVSGQIVTNRGEIKKKIQLNMFQASSCPSSGAQQPQ